MRSTGKWQLDAADTAVLIKKCYFPCKIFMKIIYFYTPEHELFVNFTRTSCTYHMFGNSANISPRTTFSIIVFSERLKSGKKAAY